MPRRVEILARVSEDGKIHDARERKQIASALAMYSGSEALIVISPKRRSSRANAYYWGVVLKTIQEAHLACGLGPVSAESLHTYFKDTMGLPRRIEVIMGDEVVVPPSTRKLTSTEFFEYVERIRTDETVSQLLLEADMWIEDPETYQEKHGVFKSFSI